MEFDAYLRFLVALIFVLALIGALTWLARRFGFGGRVTPSGTKNRRIQVLEVTAVDAKRRLVLLRRDDIEHLVLLGPNSELVVECGIASQIQPRGFAAELDGADSTELAELRPGERPAQVSEV